MNLFVTKLIDAGDDHLTGKLAVPGGYNLYDQAEDYGMAG